MSFFASALGGSLLGGILSLATRFTDMFAKSKEIEWEIKKMEAMSRLKITEAEFKSFDTSLAAGNETPVVIPSNTPVWVSAVRVLVDSFRAFTRPGLTWAMVLSLVVFIIAGVVSSPVVDVILADFVFTTSTAVMWWFGSRPMAKTKK
jgi:hypothetical protein